MKNFTIKTYESTDSEKWNAFISRAKNATFLFQRHFMEYHSDRFEDFSLMVFDNKELVAVLPANRVGNTVFSHQGLTYGGIVLEQEIRLSEVVSIVKSVLQFLHENQINTLQIKNIPSVYNRCFSDELTYALFLAEAKLTRMDCLSVIDLSQPVKYSDLRKRGIRKGKNHKLEIREENSFDGFWNEILVPNLKRKFNVKPVHSLDEISELHKRFPENIRQFNVYHEDKIVGGTTMFVTENVAHCQYISGNDQKQELGCLDYLFDYLISNVFKDKPYFDFGISNENNGRNINEGLLYWKESFGAKTVTQDFYEVETGNYKLLNDVLL